MGGNTCPDCRGELVDDSTNNRWHIELVVPNSTASGLDPDEFAIDVALASGGNHQQALSSNSGTAGATETTYNWTISRPGTPSSGEISMEHSSLGTLVQDLTIS